MKAKNNLNNNIANKNDLTEKHQTKYDLNKNHVFKHGIALNVTRTRVTVLVFNLSIISFMLSMLKSSTELSHLSTSVALFLGFCLTLLGLWLLLYSQTWDKLGLSRPWPFVLGSMTTYLALSQTVTAFMHEYLLGLKAVFQTVQLSAGKQHNFDVINETVMILLFVMGGIIWLLITYIAPLNLLVERKHPATIGRRWVLAIYYLSIQVPIYWIYARTWHLQYISEDQPLSMLQLFALQFVQPLLWWSQ